MANTKVKIKALYLEYPKFKEALMSLSGKKDLAVEVLSPIPLHDIEELFPQKPSGIRWFTFIGGILGLVLGIGFPVYTVKQWPLISGGKPAVTYQTFIVIAFELLILFGAIFTLLGLLFHARLPRANLSDYDIRISDNFYGVIVSINKAEEEEFKEIFRDAENLVIDTTL